MSVDSREFNHRPRFSFSSTLPTDTASGWPRRSLQAHAAPAPRWISGGYRRPSRLKPQEPRTSSSTNRPPVAAIADLETYDAIVVGTGTRFGRMSSQMAAFLDQAGGLWSRGALNGKIGAAFSASGTQHGGQEATLFSIITNLLHFGMTTVGLPYSHQGQMNVTEIVGGVPYGATTVAGPVGARQPTEIDLAGARHQGELVARTAAKISA